MRALLILFLLAGCAKPLPQPTYQSPPSTPEANLNQSDWIGPKPTLADLDQYVENFRRLAFWTEWNGSSPYIKKMAGSLVCITENDRFHDDVMATLSKLRVATGMRFRKGHSLQRGCPISFVDGVDKVGCSVTPVRDVSAFSHFIVGIGHGFDDDDLGECIEEELSQIMGLYNDINYPWTMWNDNNSDTVNRLTWHDAVMLRVLYQNELYQSMPEAEAMQIVPRLMRKVILEIQ